jgi:tripartite-type tricarboxylate transporter receptor subunit TctC
MRLPIARLALALALLVASGPIAGAQGVADFYRGRNVTFLIGYPTGNGYDAYARLLIRHLGRHIPGNPTIIPENMPGAGSMVMINHLYNVAVKDGSVIGLPARNLVIEPLLNNPQARFDPRKFAWIGSMNKDVAVCVAWAKTGIKSIADAKRQEVKVGATGQASDSFLLPQLANAVLGTKFKVILGYPDASSVNLALERGELDGFCTSYSAIPSSRPQWISEHQVNILAQLGLAKLAELPDVPLLLDMTEDPAAKQALTFVFANQEMGRPVAGPPGMPPDRLQALRTAFDATIRDPQLLEEAKRQRFAIDPISGADIDALMARMYATPQAMIDKVVAIRPVTEGAK